LWDADPKNKNWSEYRDFYVKQSYLAVNNDERKPRINGFRIMTPEIFSYNESGEQLYSVTEGSFEIAEASGVVTASTSLAERGGTISTINIRKQHKILKVIKLGFDFDHNPVCILADDFGIKFKPARADGIVYTMPEREFSAEERDEWPGIYERSPCDHLAWSIVKDRHVQPFFMHRGLWALRGDRRNGVDVTIPSIVDEVIAKGELDGKLVWEVYLNNLGSKPSSMVGDMVKGIFGKR
jgi:hypothetical protein